MLSPEPRMRHVMRLVDERRFFSLHAGRQTGKSTAARWLARRYNEQGRYRALWLDVQTARDLPEPPAAFHTILTEVELALDVYWPEAPRPDRAALFRDPSTAILRCFQQLAAAAPQPLVVLVDGADGLVGATMVSFLTQLRRGFLGRADTPFPHSMALIGMWAVRDQGPSSDDHRAVSWLGTTSSFQMTAEAAELEPFARDNVRDLLRQHTDHTGQPWEPEAMDLIFERSKGHPWLVNAMADQIVNRDVEDRSARITTRHVETAEERLIQQRRIHIESLLSKLREERVRRVMEPMLAGSRVGHEVLPDDFAYVVELGLISNRSGVWEVANPVYREVIVRELTFIQQTQMRYETSWYLCENGTLDMVRVMSAWQEFWREEGHRVARGFHYLRAGPHLTMMAFLQRIVHDAGRIEREYGLGRGAVDLIIHFCGQRHVVELKVRRDARSEGRGRDQVVRYLDSIGLREAWLILFDLRDEVSWDDKMFVREVDREGKILHIVGC